MYLLSRGQERSHFNPGNMEDPGLATDRALSSGNKFKSRSNLFSAGHDLLHENKAFDRGLKKSMAHEDNQADIERTSVEDEDQVLYASANRLPKPRSSGNKRPHDRSQGNFAEGYEMVAPSTWTNQYNTFIEQITRMKSELVQLGEENDDLVSMIHN